MSAWNNRTLKPGMYLVQPKEHTVHPHVYPANTVAFVEKVDDYYADLVFVSDTECSGRLLCPKDATCERFIPLDGVEAVNLPFVPIADTWLAMADGAVLLRYANGRIVAAEYGPKAGAPEMGFTVLKNGALSWLSLDEAKECGLTMALPHARHRA